MKISIIGAGAIGGLMAGYMKQKGLDVTIVGRSDAVDAMKTRGLKISGVRGDMTVDVEAAVRLACRPDLVILATKTQDIECAVEENREFLADTLILAVQNGVRAEELVARLLPGADIVSGIVMFGATLLKPGEIVHNFEGNWIVGRMDGDVDESVGRAANAAGSVFPAVITEDIRGMKYLKIFLNANNCLPGILGKSMQEVFADLDVSRISLDIWREGVDIVRGPGIELKSLPDYPVERLMKLLSMPPAEAARIFSGVMTGLSEEPLYGSVFQSIKRGKRSEIDYINGEFVRLARDRGMSAPLNAKLTEMVHVVERTGLFFSKEELWAEYKRLFPH